MESAKNDQEVYKKATDEILGDKEKKRRIIKNDSIEKGIFSMEEIKIEEMAIDGICGVY